MDPDELGRANTALIHFDAKRLERIRLGWLLKQSAEAPPDADGCVERLVRGLGDLSRTPLCHGSMSSGSALIDGRRSLPSVHLDPLPRVRSVLNGLIVRSALSFR